GRRLRARRAAGAVGRCATAVRQRELARGDHPDRHRGAAHLLLPQGVAAGRPARCALPRHRQCGRRLPGREGAQPDPGPRAEDRGGGGPRCRGDQRAGASVSWGDVLLIAGGLGAGFLSGTIGIGGGLPFVPTMTIGFRLSQAVAQGAALGAIVSPAIVGGFTHLRGGHVLIRPGLWTGGGGGGPRLRADGGGRVPAGAGGRRGRAAGRRGAAGGGGRLPPPARGQGARPAGAGGGGGGGGGGRDRGAGGRGGARPDPGPRLGG